MKPSFFFRKLLSIFNPVVVSRESYLVLKRTVRLSYVSFINLLYLQAASALFFELIPLMPLKFKPIS